MAKQRIDIPFGAMDISEADHVAPPSTLRTASNVRPAGPERRPYWTPIEGDLQVGTLEGIYAIGMQVRQRKGDLADLAGDPEQSLERQIWITDSEIYIADPDQLYAAKSVYTFPTSSTTRKAQFCQIGDDVFITTVTGAGIGTPEHLLLLRDDEVVDIADVPAPPSVTVTAASTSNEALDPGRYQLRYGWLFKDGTVAKVSRPEIVDVGTSGDALGTDYYTLTFTLGTVSLSSAWSSLISGVVVFLSPRYGFESEEVDKLMQAPVYRVAEVTNLGTGAVQTWSDHSDDIYSYEQIDDENLLTHDISAGACFAYNKRLVVGDVTIDLYRPPSAEIVAAGTGTDYYLMFRIDIRTSNGVITRFTDPIGFTAAEAGSLSAPEVIAYPDVRAERIRWYVSTDYAGDADAATWDELFTNPATNNITRLRSGGGNFAYQHVGAGTVLDLTVASPDETLDVSGANAKVDHDVNRVITSQTFQPFALEASNVLYVGAGPEDAVIGFAVNALPISEGQFGDYPLMVLCRETVTALTPGQTIAWARNEVTARKGCVGRYAFTNVEDLIVFAARDGIWSLSPQIGREPISRPIQNNATIDDFYACLSHDVALGYLNDRQRGRRELWVATEGLCYIWSLPYGWWSIAPRSRRSFLYHDGRLFGVEAVDRGVWNEAAEHRLMEFFLRTTRQYLALPSGDPAIGYAKRIYGIWLRQRTQVTRMQWALTDFNQDGSTFTVRTQILNAGQRDAIPIPRGMCREPYLDLVGEAYPGQALEGLGFEYRIDVSHRLPETVPNITFELPFNCADGLKVVVPPPPADEPEPPPGDEDPAPSEPTEITVIFLTEQRLSADIDADDIWNIYRYDVEEDTLLTLRQGTKSDDSMEMNGIAYRAFDKKVYRYQSKSGVGGRIYRTDIDGANEELVNPNTGLTADDIANVANRQFVIDEEDDVGYISHGGDTLRAPLDGILYDFIDGPDTFYGIFFDGERFLYGVSSQGSIWRFDKDTEDQAYDGTYYYYHPTELVTGITDGWGITSDGTYLYVITQDEKLYRVGLDGSGLTLLVEGFFPNCRNLAYLENKLYWVASNTVLGEGYIRQANKNGGGLQTLKTIDAVAGYYRGLQGIDVAKITLEGTTTEDIWVTATDEEVLTQSGEQVIVLG